MSYYIHYLRGFAALVVVIHHAELFLLSRNDSGTASFLWGAWGVDVFFVISGFVMVRAVEFAPRPTIGQFFIKRAIRIIPLYWLITLMLVGVFYFAPRLVPSAHYSTSEIVKSFVLVPYLNASGDFRPVVSQGWTLAFELVFYGFVGFALVVRLKRPVLSAALLLAVFVIGCHSFASAGLPREVLYLFSPIAVEFLLGVVAGYVDNRLPINAPWTWGLSAVLTGVGCVLMVILNPVEGTGLDRLILWGIPAFLFVLALLVAERTLRKRAFLPGFVLLGDASYATYLVHGVSFSVIYKLLAPHVDKAFGLAVLLIFFATLAGVLVHRLVEAPLQERLLRQTS